jgi:hypothetical protein
MAKKYTFLAALIVGLALSATTLTGQVRINGIWSNWFSNVLTMASTSNGQMLTQIKAGTGDPEGSVTAPAGSIYMRTNGTVYKKSSGSGNTDWDAFAAGAGAGDALTTDPLSQFAATTSLQLAGVISNETGSGALVFGTAPTLDAAVLTTKVNVPRVTALPGTPSAGDTVVVTDDSAVGACDSAAGAAISLCMYTGSAWDAIGDGGSGGGLASTDIDTCAEWAAIITGETGTCGSVVRSASPTFTGTVIAAAITGSGAFASTTLDTGQGANELYDMDQNVLTTSTPTFSTLTVTTEAYDDTGWNGDNTVPTKDAVRDVIATIATFTDPNADKFIFWDDSAGAFVALDMPAAFSIGGTTATLTLPYTLQFTAAVCQNATASLGMSTPSSVAATAGCITVAGGSGDAALGYAVFPTGGADTELHGSFELGSDWTGAVDATIKWMSNSTASGDVVWEIGIGCVANDEVTGAPTFDDTAFTADANHTGAALRLNTATKTGLTVSTCSAGETAMFIIHRDTDTAGDTLDQDVRLVSITFTLRRSVS